jgi:FdhD protein
MAGEGERLGASTSESRLLRVGEGGAEAAADRLATEEPLEIRLRAGGDEAAVAVTMRTPGADEELALGFLFAEGVIAGRGEVAALTAIDDPWGGPGKPSNVLAVELRAPALPDLARLERHFFASSACGVCGKAGIENLRLRGCAPPGAGPRVEPWVLHGLPAVLARSQGVFAATGGLHAAALFDAGGALLALREDVGRHNALDKLVGWGLGEGRLPFADGIVLVSGRSSFEILQKCVAAGVGIVCSVSAPSSLAVDLAREFGVTLVGFLRDGRFNLYAGSERLGLAGV